ncbi:unnamed protein product [Clavelina lepadiformis]|uniref:Magnesium-dependent phosphatase 1 n=1 Tax=Clavelina lepadiformis TaxID=159417 RepID=A0ABP0GX18_CLALP
MKPKLIVFDLDYTLWPFWVDTHVTPPFCKERDGKVYDANRQVVNLYPDSLEILKHLKDNDYDLAVASRTGSTEEAEQLLHLFDMNKYFVMKQIYPGRKTTHFSKFQNAFNHCYTDMLFFDDEHRNIRDLSSIGVTCVLVEEGMNWDYLNRGLNLHKEKKSS